MTTTAEHQEQRRAVRRQPALGTVFRLEDDSAIGLVWNLSTTGVSMLFHTQPQPGDMLRGDLVTAGNRITLPVSLRVAHACKVRTGDYFVGAQFEAALSDEQLHPFLGERSER
jgi:hypothetical protein